ncbi:MAG: hypothetical protein ACRELY_22490 [Polyangiaceae bacterium]
MSLSTWIAQAAADRVRNEALGQALDQWEADTGGGFTEGELNAAARALGLLPKTRKRK